MPQLAKIHVHSLCPLPLAAPTFPPKPRRSLPGEGQSKPFPYWGAQDGFHHSKVVNKPGQVLGVSESSPSQVCVTRCYIYPAGAMSRIKMISIKAALHNRKYHSFGLL